MPPDHPTQVAEKMVEILVSERTRKGLSINKLSWMSGISPSALSFIEKRVHSPTLKTFLRIAAALELDVSKVYWEADTLVHRQK